ncbi:MAG: SMC-Scp complex subunit ScpB [Oscillospiraceae bacterium]
MENQELEAAIEAILFAAGEPVPAERIALVLGLDTELVLACAKQLSDDYAFRRRGIRLVRVNDALQLCSAAEFAQPITQALERRRPPKLSQSSLEVLAICAYFQPVTRAYVEQVRGVDSSYTMGVLQERGLIESCGRLEVPGRPSIYKTTELFLRTLGITNIAELPKLPDMSTDEGISRLNAVIDALKSPDNEQLKIDD